jgi:hypothetical protein
MSGRNLVGTEKDVPLVFRTASLAFGDIALDFPVVFEPRQERGQHGQSAICFERCALGNSGVP